MKNVSSQPDTAIFLHTVARVVALRAVETGGRADLRMVSCVTQGFVSQQHPNGGEKALIK